VRQRQEVQEVLFKSMMENDQTIKLRTRPERQRRFLKARAIKFNRKLARLGQKAVEPKTFSNLYCEGQTLLVFMAIDSWNHQKQSS